MADAGTLKPGMKVMHPDWPAGETARILEMNRQQVRIRRGKRGQVLKPWQEDFENVARLDREFPACPGSKEMDAYWMECGLVALPD